MKYVDPLVVNLKKKKEFKQFHFSSTQILLWNSFKFWSKIQVWLANDILSWFAGIGSGSEYLGDVITDLWF